LLFAVFLGIVAWAYSAKRKRRFDAAARAPLDDDEA
jgi:cbb3-type cytochrome oxidase subunit 3